MPVPYEPIPDSTQAYVDRLIGTQVGGFEVLARVTEGRLGTIYRGQQVASGKPVTIEVLRSELVGDDEAAKAANAIKVVGIAAVLGFGELPDGRRYRVMELLEGESLDQRRRLSPRETTQILDQVAIVLEAAHAWAIVHGSLGPSSVFVREGAVKVIDFGLAKKKVAPLDDLKALGALGFTLLTGAELREGAPPPPMSAAIPAALHQLLLDLLAARAPNATSVRKSLVVVTQQLQTPLAPAQPKRSRGGVLIVVAAGVIAAAAAFVLWPVTAEPVPTVPEVLLAPEEVEEDVASLEEPPALTPEEPVKPGEPPRPVRPRPSRAVPTAKALSELTSRLEAQLRKHARPGDDVEQALYVLNKQRLRLTGSPTLEDRKEVARQLAGWKRSYLRP